MNSDLYTDEYKNFRFLKCSSSAVDYYKQTEKHLNSIQPDLQSDPNFVWKTRLEFIEQLLDLRNDVVYIVESGDLYSARPGIYSYEAARIRTIIKPVVYQGHPLAPEEGIVATLDDISLIENPELNAHFYLCSEEYFISDREIIDTEKDFGYILRLDGNPLIPSNHIPSTALFYDKEWANKYQVALTKFLRYNSDAVSAITGLLPT